MRPTVGGRSFSTSYQNPASTAHEQHLRRVECSASSADSPSSGAPAGLAVFVSGGGSNFKSIHAAILDGRINGKVSCVVSDKPECGGCDYARTHGIPVLAYPKSKKFAPDGLDPPEMVSQLKSFGVDYVLLAGYLKLLPEELVQAFPRAIVNIHPALLPAFGGKGYYGMKVHEAVVRSGARVSGPTIHFVDEKFDNGPIVAQSVVPVYHTDSPKELQERVLKEEHKLYPEVVSALCSGRIAWREDGIPYVLEKVNSEIALV